MKTVLLDTNFLLIPYQFKVDVFSEIERVMMCSYKLAVLGKAIKELEYLKEKSRKERDREAAAYALKLLKAKSIKIIGTNSKGGVDEETVRYASENGAVVATQDKELKRRLWKKGIPLIIMRQKQKLEYLTPALE